MRKSSPYVSAQLHPVVYPLGVTSPYKTVNNWGARFRQAIKLKGLNLAKVSELMKVHEATVRSWTNGHRSINLSEFIELCNAAKVEPRDVLFGVEDQNLLALIDAWRQADDSERQLLRIAAEAVLRRRGFGRRKGDSAL